MLAPDGMFPQMPAVVAPEHDDGVLAQLQFIQPHQQPTHHCIGIGHAGCVVFAHFNGKFRIGIWITFPTVVLHELT